MSTASKRSKAVAVRNQSQSHIIADGLCPQIRELTQGALHELTAIGATHNPIAAIGAVLSEQRLQGKNTDVLHIVAHGRSGAFQLGGQWITASDLISNAAELARWQVRQLALWSCEVGADRTMVALLEELTGATV